MNIILTIFAKLGDVITINIPSGFPESGEKVEKAEKWKTKSVEVNLMYLWR